MRLTHLVDQLALKIDPESNAGEDVAVSAARTALIAQITALDAARAGSVGRGLQLAAEELHELALLTGSQDENIRMLGRSTQKILSQVRILTAGLMQNTWTDTKQVHSEIIRLKDEIALLICDLVRKISAMPQSIGDYEAPQSADRVQIETLLRQAMINGRDRMTAIEIVLEAMIDCCAGSSDIEKLATLDSESLDYPLRQRLAGLTRDQQLDSRILASGNSSH